MRTPDHPNALVGAQNRSLTRRHFIQTSGIALAGTAAAGCATHQAGPEPIVDIHQHVGYSGRTDPVFLDHQRSMSIRKTILLPAGRPLNSPATHNGETNGLEAKCLGNEACFRFAQTDPQHYAFGANEVPTAPGATREIEKYLKLGAVIIAELKFGVECDSPEMRRIYDLAADYHVPVLMHWQYQRFNYGFQRFHTMLAAHRRTHFIGHAQTWWAHIDASYRDDTANLYPKGDVTSGGLTDRYLSDYPNAYGDLSAGSCPDALTRDEDHAQEFLVRHQDKLLYGSDCNDGVGSGTACQGAQTIATLKRLVDEPAILQKLFYRNARRLMRV